MTIRYLTSVLTSLLLAAANHEGKALVELKHGLRVSVCLTPNKIHLHLSRPDKYPSDQELVTILTAWPSPVRATLSQKSENGRYFLSTSFPRR